jgi:hypothetical protein
MTQRVFNHQAFQRDAAVANHHAHGMEVAAQVMPVLPDSSPESMPPLLSFTQ